VKILVDMNLSPQWVPFLSGKGIESVHWSSVGRPDADDPTIMEWARQEGFVLFTHDLDVGTVLAYTRARGPSVIQVRTQDVMPGKLGPLLLAVLREHEGALIQGAIVVVEEAQSRVRILPVK